MKKRYYFIISVVVHLVLIFFQMGSSGKGRGGSGHKNESIAPKENKNEKIDVVIVGPGEKKKKSPKHAGDKCKDYFGGIGITISPINGQILYVYPDYPAADAGILIGDIISSNEEIRGPVGSPVAINVLRDGQSFSVVLIRDKICTYR